MAEIRIQSESCELVPGRMNRVPIVLVVDQPLKARGLHATFHGAEETKAVYVAYDPATKTTMPKTAVEHFDIVKTEHVLSGSEQRGFFGNLADGLATLFGGGDHEVLQPGEYPFEVEVTVPTDARPSFHGEKCRVFYELSAYVDIPLARDVKALASFEVIAPPDESLTSGGPVRTRYPEDESRGLFDSLFSPDVRVEVALAEGLIREGDTVEGMFVIDTPKPLEYRQMQVRLIAVENTTASGHGDRYVHEGESVQLEADGTIEGTYSKEFRLPAVNPGAKSDRGQAFSIDCFVQIEMDVPWAKDPRVRVPITLL